MPNPEANERLYRLNRALKASGMGKLTDEELDDLYKQMQQAGVRDPAQFQEGGLISDSSGEATRRMRGGMS